MKKVAGTPAANLRQGCLWGRSAGAGRAALGGRHRWHRRWRRAGVAPRVRATGLAAARRVAAPQPRACRLRAEPQTVAGLADAGTGRLLRDVLSHNQPDPVTALDPGCTARARNRDR